MLSIRKLPGKSIPLFSLAFGRRPTRQAPIRMVSSRFRMRRLYILAAAAVLLASFIGADIGSGDNKLWEYRNLGKAFYENPDTHVQAVDALHSALELAPHSVREHINYGLALLRAGRNDAAVAELSEAQKQNASLPYTWFNLGIFYKHAGDYDKAIEQFRGMLRLTPEEP